jgi:predicted nucleic acid-binding protein
MNTANGTRLRVVLDTNVYVSALMHPKGQVFRIWKPTVRPMYHLLVSPAIMREVSKVLRDRFG